jgi:hypothetical protein
MGEVDEKLRVNGVGQGGQEEEGEEPGGEENALLRTNAT